MIKLPNVKGLMSVGKAFTMAHRPELLFGASIASTLGAVVMAAKGGYESGQQVMRAEYPNLLSEDEKIELSVKEKIQLTWLNYLPAAGLTAGALGSTTGLHIVHIKEKKAIAAAALMAIDEIRHEAKEYKDEVLEIVSDPEKKPSQKVKEIEKSVMDTDGDVLSERYLVRDPISGRDIWANKAQIEEAIVEVGNLINGSGEASLNNFWEEAGWGTLPIGESLGWSGVIPSISWVDEMRQPIAHVRDDGRPVRGFRFHPDPQKGFDDPHR